ncbi:MAG: hypothetical protein IPK97_01630 [Ahniella sp.]|nr:hypothetical protein [Ahniella sp.]
MSPRFLPVVLTDQLVPGSFAHAAHHLVGALERSAFDTLYPNNPTGATASILIKA